ncbi:excinuclease ABC subunit UvrC [Candidatus Saccharibacteria bacterium]|nr:excinuclease ABC subunit UvrC [Candidatus Saccharibacteria bacterium]
MNVKLEKKLKKLPSSPGVYFHKSASGEIIYIGKAANLLNRVRQYFQSSRYRDPKTDLLIAEIADVDWTPVETEVDALFLEAELVRRYLPRYNILLRDDKSLSYARINYKSDYPTVSLIRHPLDDDADYFGPYINSLALKKALRYLRRAFPYAVSKPVGQKRSSLHYHLGLDPGLEDGRTSLTDYRANLRKLMQYLRGNRVALMKKIEKDMKQAARAEQFEKAAKLRNQLFSLQALSRQVLFGDHEIQAASRDQALIELAGLLGLYENEPQLAYADGVQGAGEQRTEAYGEQYDEGAAQPATPQSAVRSGGMPSSARQQARPLRKLRRIEGFDVSHIQGSDTTASMVVFASGLPYKAAYRKFKMRLAGNDDFAHMFEAVHRRFSDRNIKKWGLPDLVLIDGGKGQLAAALKARDDGGRSHIPMIGLAKRFEEIIVRKPNEVNSFKVIKLSQNSHLVKLLQRIRDESHRFALSYHSSLRRHRQTASMLEEIPGFGPVTRKKLIKTFGSVKEITQTSEASIALSIGTHKAKLLRGYLDSYKKI